MTYKSGGINNISFLNCALGPLVKIGNIFMKRYFAILLMLCLNSTSVWSDTWSSYVVLTSVQPLTEWGGGMIRVQPSTSTNPATCTNSGVYDFTYDSGTQESRSAVVAAIYAAFTSGKQIRFYIDSDSCSPGNAPIIRGVFLIP